MTISYSDSFSHLLLKWKGSLYKEVFRFCIFFYAAFYAVLAAQYFLLKEAWQKEVFAQYVALCKQGLNHIPIAFLLGFFVSSIVARWWSQFNLISWPDKLMMVVDCYLGGENMIPVRRVFARWSTLQAAMVWRTISVRSYKRFPTEKHLVISGLMNEEEYDMFMNTEAPHGKWFIPILWMNHLLRKLHQEGLLKDGAFRHLIKELQSYRGGFATLYVYDWIKIPLVYTQVVAIATYGYFLICILGRQPDLHKGGAQLWFPIFTTLEIFFYMGWLKVAQALMNPFGEDDDDFELNYILDRNTEIAYMLAERTSDQLPHFEGDDLLSKTRLLPHTVASTKIRDVVPVSYLTAKKYCLSDKQTKVVSPQEFQHKELQKKLDDERAQSAVGRFRKVVGLKMKDKREAEREMEALEAHKVAEQKGDEDGDEQANLLLHQKMVLESPKKD